MSVSIKEYHEELKKRFEMEAERLRGVLGSDVIIEHVGSSAVGIGGKNIVDILVGVKDVNEMKMVRDKIIPLDYREGHDTHPDRIFMAWRNNDDGSDRETGEGDYHVHIVVKESEECMNMIRLRDYLRANPDEAKKYFEMKSVFAKDAGYDRKKYKALKSSYVGKLIEKAKAEDIGR